MIDCHYPLIKKDLEGGIVDVDRKKEKKKYRIEDEIILNKIEVLKSEISFVFVT